MTEDDVSKIVIGIVEGCAPKPPEVLTPDLHLIADLNYDSLAVVELATELELEFAIEPIDEELLVTLTTVRDVVDLMTKLVAQPLQNVVIDLRRTADSDYHRVPIEPRPEDERTEVSQMGRLRIT